VNITPFWDSILSKAQRPTLARSVPTTRGRGNGRSHFWSSFFRQKETRQREYLSKCCFFFFLQRQNAEAVAAFQRDSIRSRRQLIVILKGEDMIIHRSTGADFKQCGWPDRWRGRGQLKHGSSEASASRWTRAAEIRATKSQGHYWPTG